MTIQKYLRVIIANLDTVLAIVASVIATLYGFFGGPEGKDPYLSYLLSGVGITLGLLAFGLTRDRLARDEFLSQVKRVENSIARLEAGRNVNGVLLDDWPPS